jgi:biotin-dependent carboxylase-like uncharacterized protein
MIKVLSPGFYATIQDAGRSNLASIGVPVSGAMDSFSSSISNQVLGNKKTAAVIEITFGGCQFLFESATIICLSGADFSATLNNQIIPLNTAVEVIENDVLSFGKRVYGVRTYLAVQGGLQSEVVLNSRSYFKGITTNWKLKKEQKIKIKNHFPAKKKTFSLIKTNASLFERKEIVCYEGPEFDLLSNQQIEQIKHINFSVSSKNNRMGFQLKERIENKLSPILTSGVLPGTVQLTPSGTLIVLMRDCQVTGGYPRVLQLSEASITCLAQKYTKDQFQFLIEDL